MTRQNIMLDIETLDTSANAVVISIGAVGFKFDGSRQTFPFYRSIAYQDQINIRRHVSASTLEFWSAQSDEARGAAFDGKDRLETGYALQELTAFIERHDEPLIWAYPACFDLSIMEDLYEDFGEDIPWHHRDRRCARTLYSLAGNPDFDHKGHVLAHHPVSDCQVQITQAHVAYQTLKRVGPNIA